ncbi:MAG: hypothetical protein ACK4GE_02705 [Caldimicrobium sp.]
MKVGRWKVLGLAGVLTLGYVVTSEAAQIKVSDETWANFGLNMKIWYFHWDKRSNDTVAGGWSQNEFRVGQSKIYFTGQVNKLFQFYSELDAASPGITELGEAGINFAFAKEFQALVGRIRKPFTRNQIVSGYAELTPRGAWLDPQGVIDPIRGQIRRADLGLMLHGDLAGGILNYRIGVFNENKADTKLWLGDGAQRWVAPPVDPNKKRNDFKNFEWAARVEFQPLMLGFKPASAATITAKSADTFLGKQDVFIIGLGYNKEKHTHKLRLAPNNIKDLDRSAWTMDATIEKKVGNVVPNLQLGYISLDESHFYNKYTRGQNAWQVTPKKGDTDLYYIQGQLLYDQVVGFGKPALAFRYEKIEADGEYVPALNNLTVHKKDLEVSTFGLALNYYIKGNAARVSIGFDTSKYDGAASAFLKRSGIANPNVKEKDRITDWYLYLQSQF